MPERIRSLALNGIEGYEVTVECDIAGGLPSFDVVGLPDAAVRESRERVRAAMKNSGLAFPARRITVNLAPAGTRKTGSLYDLPILLSILLAQGTLDTLPEDAVFLATCAQRRACCLWRLRRVTWEYVRFTVRLQMPGRRPLRAGWTSIPLRRWTRFWRI